MDIALLNDVVLVQHQQVPTALVLLQRAVRHQQCALHDLPHGKTDLDEDARQQRAVRIAQDTPHEEGSRGLIDRRSDILDSSVMRVAGFVRQCHIDRDPVQLIQAQAPLVQVGPDLQRLLRADIGNHVDRIQLDDIDEGGFLAVASDDIAGIDQVLSHLAIEWCPDLRIAQVQLSKGDLGLCRKDICLCALLFEIPMIDIELCRCIFLEQGLVATHLGLRIEQRRLLQLELRLRLLQLRLVLVLLDRDQEIALLDQRAIREMQLVQEAHDLRDELHLVHGCSVAGDLDDNR